MIKRLLFSFLVLISVVSVNAQQTVIEAKQVKAVDSLKLKTDWITNIIKDSSLTGATVRNFPATDAVVKYIANRLAYTVKYSDTAGLIAGYVRETRFIDSLSAVQTRIQGKLTKSDADTYYPAIQRMIDSLTAVQTRIQDKLTKSDADTYYPAIQRMNDSLSAVQTRIQSKLTKSDADTYYPAIQRMIDSLTAVQTRIQGKLTKSDADTYYPAIQRMIDSLSAVQTRIQGKLTKSDADTYYPAIQRVLDSLTAMQSRIQTKQPLLGYTAENSANKATDFSTVNNVLYPTVQAVSTYIQSALTGVLKDRGNYDASGNTFPASGGSGSGGAIKTGDMWYISVGGTLGGKAVTAGAWVRSLTDAPGQTAGNWAIADGGFGFVPENVANKSTSTSLGNSNTAYPSQNAVKTYVDNATANASNWNTAYNKRPSSASISSSTFTLTLGDGTTVTASIPTFNQNTTGNAATVTNGVYTNTFNGLGDARYLQLTGGTLTGTLYGVNAIYSGPTTSQRFDISADGSGVVLQGYVDNVLRIAARGSNYNSGARGGLLANTGEFDGLITGTNTAANQAVFYGWNNMDGSSVNAGEIRIASNSAYQGRIIYSPSGNTTLYLDNSFNDPGAAISFRLRTAGTAITALTLYGTGNVSAFGDLTVATNTPTLKLDGTSYGSVTSSVEYYGWTTAYKNWKVGVNISGAGGFEFTPSTAAGGTTFGSTPVVNFSESGLITANKYVANGVNDVFATVSAGTSGIYGQVNNTGGVLYWGKESSTGSTFSTSAYASVIVSTGAYPLIFQTNSITALTLASNQAATFASTVMADHYAENTVSVSSAYTVADDVGTVFASSHSYTITLPSASSFPGRIITIKRTSSGFGNSIIISGVSLDTSEQGGALPCGASAVYRSNGSGWYVISYHAGGCN